MSVLNGKGGSAGPFNGTSRDIEAEVLIYFFGTPLVVDKSNYLMSFNVLNELGSKSSSNPLGDVSANELDLKLFNPDGLFSPSNANSPYYGLMRAGVKVEVKIREVGYAWVKLGTFYVNDWYAKVTNLVASVTCYDKLQDILSYSVNTKVAKGVTYAQAFDDALSTSVVQHEIDSGLTGKLSWWYSLPKMSDTLNMLSGACFAPVFCDTAGIIRVINATAPREVAYTITDDDQLISADVPQSITSDFDGLNVSTCLTQLSDSERILDVKNYTASVGTLTSQPLKYNKGSVARVESVLLGSKSAQVTLLGFQGTPSDISIVLRNEGLEFTNVDLSVYGRYVESVKKVYNSYGIRPLTFDNVYCQNDEAAALISSVLDKYVSSPLPYLEADIRGNPGMQLGDKIHVHSDKYMIDFVGILQRAEYSYDGSLKCSINLVDSRILEVS